MNGLLALSVSDLTALKEALRTGRLPTPFLPALIERMVPRAVSGDVSAALQGMAAAGTNREGLVAAIELLAAARAQQRSIDEVIELVTTGPEAGTITNRDTQVVVQELFRNAEHSVLVAGYELYQAEPVFRTLAERMAAIRGHQHRRRDHRRFRTSLSHRSLADRSSFAGDLLRSAIACDRRKTEGGSSRQMHCRRWTNGIRVVRQLHGGSPGTKHRSQGFGALTNCRGTSYLFLCGVSLHRGVEASTLTYRFRE